jgi:hypothetical protein
VGEGRASGSKVSVYEAAELMDVTVDAIRKRISRDTIPHERDDDGRVWVILDTDQDTSSNVRDSDQPQSATDALISQMQERIASLERQLDQEREANSEHRRLLLRALERIPPQIEAPQEAPQTAEGEPERAEPQSTTVESQEPVQRPWWRRILRG